MLCSQCSAPVVPVVAVDIDGTLGDYHQHFLWFADTWLGTLTVNGKAVPSSARYHGDEPYRDWFCRLTGVDTTTFRQIKLAYRQGGMKRTMPPYPHAGELTLALRERAEVWLTTTRPHDRYDRIAPDTVEWLRRNQIPYDALLFNEDKLAQLYDTVDPARVVAVLDDEVDVLAQVTAGVPVLRRTRYNDKASWAGRKVSTLAGAMTMVNKLLTDWERQHGRA